MDSNYIQASAIFDGPKIKGYIDFIEIINKKKVQINISLSGLNKNSYYGFHIHDVYDINSECNWLCSHFNPYIESGPGREKKVGDLLNIISDDNGTICLNTINRTIQLQHGSCNVIGRSLIIKEYIDEDMNTNERLAISVIGYYNAF